MEKQIKVNETQITQNKELFSQGHMQFEDAQLISGIYTK
jgi:hypothetical protein